MQTSKLTFSANLTTEGNTFDCFGHLACQKDQRLHLLKF